MKYFKFASGLLAISFGVRLARAETVAGLGGGYRYLNYAEDVPSPLLSTQFGWIPDVWAYAEHKPEDRSWLASAKIDYAWGNLTYNGTSQPPDVTSIVSVDTHEFAVFEGLFGWRLGQLVSGSYDFYVYGGLSYRLWYRNLGNPSEVYKLLTIPLGVRLDPSTKSSFSIGYDLSLRPMVYGTVSATYSAQTGYDPQTVPVSIGYLGLRLEVPLRFALSGAWGLTVRPWFEYSTISQGSAVLITSNGQKIPDEGGGYLAASEPSSRTFQAGTNVSLETAF